MSLHALETPTPLDASVRRRGDAAVLTLIGTLDPADPVLAGSSVEATMKAVEAALETRPRALVVDLHRAELSRFMIGLLGLVRRRSGRIGVPLLLAAVPPSGREMLTVARVAPLYPVFPTMAAAIGAVGTTARKPA